MSNEFSPLLPYADISIDENGLPSSEHYGDSYFSRHGGLDETRYVFIEGNRLQERWQSQPHFVIAETGFGTGLNFLATCQAWAERPRSGWLHYISTELHPINGNTLQQIHSQWPELASFARALQQQWPIPHSGFHRIHLAEHRITLTLLFGDAAATLPQLSAKVDAWYLDGFSPNQNEGLWNSDLYQTIAKLTASGGSFATYTAAGHVRRGLAEAGFDVSKQSGFGHKKDMTVGSKPGTVTPQDRPELVEITGAGIAGCTLARNLAERGIRVAIFDRRSGIASQASGVFAGLIRPWPELTRSIRERYFETAFLTAQQRLQDQHADWIQHSGVAQQFVDTERANKIFARGFSEKLMHKHGEHLRYPGGMTINPKALCKDLLDHPNIEILYGVASNDNIDPSIPLVLAGGWRQAELTQPEGCRLQFIRGQLSHIAASPPQTAECKNGHWLAYPGESGSVIGSSFVPNCQDTDIRPEEHAETVTKLQGDKILPLDDTKARGMYASIRLTTNDRMPLVGRLGSPNDNNTYVSTAHGSRGFTGSWLAAEILASQILGEPLPIEGDLIQAVNPARFSKV